MARYWLVGECRSRNPDDAEAWLTPDDRGPIQPANRLLELTGWSLEAFLSTLNPRRSLLVNPRRVWSAEGMRQAAEMKRQSLADGSGGIIVLGRLAARMFGLTDEEPMAWRGRLAFVPHPGRQSRYWTPETRARARAFFETLLLPAIGRRKTVGS